MTHSFIPGKHCDKHGSPFIGLPKVYRLQDLPCPECAYLEYGNKAMATINIKNRQIDFIIEPLGWHLLDGSEGCGIVWVPCN
jgi:hypothetical protein